MSMYTDIINITLMCETIYYSHRYLAWYETNIKKWLRPLNSKLKIYLTILHVQLLLSGKILSEKEKKTRKQTSFEEVKTLIWYKFGPTSPTLKRKSHACISRC